MSATLPEPTAEMTYRPSHEIDVRFALVWDHTVRLRAGVYWWTTLTPQGPAAVAFRLGNGLVRADGWGTGTDWAFTQLPALLGGKDDPGDFSTDHPKLRPLAPKFSAFRIGATGRWYEALAMTVVGQRVVTKDADTSREKLSHRYGEATIAGPAKTFPSPAALLRLTDADFHRAGIERSRARAMRIAAKYADRIERLDGIPAPDAHEWLHGLPGLGPWTIGIATAIAGGDPDAVPVGDLHLPRTVTYALTGEENGTDETMLTALEPFAGHRGRVVRMVKMGGGGQPNHRPNPFRYDISQI